MNNAIIQVLVIDYLVAVSNKILITVISVRYLRNYIVVTNFLIAEPSKAIRDAPNILQDVIQESRLLNIWISKPRC